LPIGDRQLGRAGVHNRGTWNGSVTAEVIANTGMQSAFNSARLAACDASHLLPYGDNRVQNSISLKSWGSRLEAVRYDKRLTESTWEEEEPSENP